MFRRNSAYNSTFGKNQGTGQEIVSYKFTSISAINYNAELEVEGQVCTAIQDG